MPDAAGIDSQLARGKFTDEMLAEMRALIGTELRTDACVNNEDATRLAILRFCEGIGDGNPLFTDPKYAATTPHGSWPAMTGPLTLPRPSDAVSPEAR